MKTLLIILACITVLSCTKKKTTHYSSTGTITGIDLGACACCGGYMLRITGSDSSYRFFPFPTGIGIDSTHFPINVSFNYVVNGTCAFNHFITLTSVVKTD